MRLLNKRWLFATVIVSLLFQTKALAQTSLTIISPDNTHAETVAPPREDHQFWNEAQFIKHINEKQDIVLIGVVRVGRDWRRPVDERMGVGYALKLDKHFTIMPTYIHVEYQPYPTRIIHEERLILNVTGKYNLGQFAFTDRNLFERRLRPGTHDFSVYRNRLQIDHPARIGEFKFRPFVADELWYSTQSRSASQGAGDFGWFRNRISAGISKQLSKHLLGDFFLLYQHDGLTRPGNIPVAGTLFRYTF